MTRKHLFLFFPVLLVLLTSLACGSSNTGEKAGSAASSAASTDQPAVQMQMYKVGDIVKVSDHTITLNSAGVNGGILTANFSVSNTSNKDVTISSLASFEAKDGEGTKLEQAMFDCANGLGGTVLPGDKLKGNLCWNVPAAASGIRIYYRANLFGSGAVVWQVDSAAAAKSGNTQSQGQTAATEAPAAATSGQRNKAGEVVKVEDGSIVLNSAKISSGVLVANFTVTNQGKKDIAVSSMLNFEAKDSEGTKLEQDIVNCPSGSLDGSIPTGDKLKGNICWTVSTSSNGIRLYYTANPFGGQAVVWDVR